MSQKILQLHLDSPKSLEALTLFLKLRVANCATKYFDFGDNNTTFIKLGILDLKIT